MHVWKHLQYSWRNQRGSQGLQAAGAALAAALIIVALLASSTDAVAPAVERAFNCAAAVLTGGGSCAGTAAEPGGGAPPGGGSATGDDRPWYERAWDWVQDNVLSPIGDFFAGAWDWLTKEREFTWWKDAMQWLRDRGWFGNILAEGIGFLTDLLIGIDANGKFSWGGVIFSLGTTILSFFGVGLLAKIPVLGKLFKGGGALSKLWTAFKGTRFGKWLVRFGTEGIADVLQGKFGTILDEVGRFLSKRFPIIAKIVGAVIPGTDIRILKNIGNYTWRLITEGPVGIVKDIIKNITKDVLRNPVFRRLYQWKGLRDIFEWFQNLGSSGP